MDNMSNYETWAFEALEWTWYMLRGYKDKPTGVDEARKTIQELLAHIGRGDQINFREQLSTLNS